MSRMFVPQVLASCPPRDTRLWLDCKTCSAPMRSDGDGCTSSSRHHRRIVELRYYATWTTTLQNLRAIHVEGARILAGPDQLRVVGPSSSPPLPWALDNGAWGAFKNERPWDEAAFREVLRRWALGADFVIVPDIVAGGLKSLEMSLDWLPTIRRHTHLSLLAVQDGMEPADIAPHLGAGVGIFVGGSTAWKWRTLEQWAKLAQARGVPCHVGRVNTVRAIAECIRVGATSADGTSLSRFSVNAPRLGNATRRPAHPDLFVESPL